MFNLYGVSCMDEKKRDEQEKTVNTSPIEKPKPKPKPEKNKIVFE